MGCLCSKNTRWKPGYEEPTVLAAETPFTVSEVEALYELFKKLSSSIIDDGLIQKEEFQFALFRNRNKRNLFADRIFDLFDVNSNGVIEFGEFVRSLGVFHPNASVADKTTFAFRLYDLKHTGFIERDEASIANCIFLLKEMVLALLHESDLVLLDDDVELIVDKTFNDADAKGDGQIDQEEWKEFVSKNPSLIKNMTLPYLKDLTLAFPSFVVSTEVDTMLKGEDLQLLQDSEVDTTTVLVANQSSPSQMSVSGGSQLSSIIPQPPSLQQHLVSSIQPQFWSQQNLPHESFNPPQFSGSFGQHMPQHYFPFSTKPFTGGRGQGPSLPCDICGRNNHTTGYCSYNPQQPFDYNSLQWRSSYPISPWVSPPWMASPHVSYSGQPRSFSGQPSSGYTFSGIPMHQPGQPSLNRFSGPSSSTSRVPHGFGGPFMPPQAHFADTSGTFQGFPFADSFAMPITFNVSHAVDISSPTWGGSSLVLIGYEDTRKNSSSMTARSGCREARLILAASFYMMFVLSLSPHAMQQQM
ncbi:hypothetical protein RHMOL_Rhmol03G0230900 [Rhododendron molle]|uniref:Uncharacterized protein n=1 Tax=Rhododendron molle TaxID=49168 RepID=A0ACC0PHX5_RHOML|nr:hypothetical protein RHMOL_Rhmol03G0230900 [Rhododendron molle]